MLFTLPPAGGWSIAISISVCLSVCLYLLSQKPQIQILQTFQYMLPAGYLSPLLAMWEVMCFWFCGWNVMFSHSRANGQESEMRSSLPGWRQRGRSLPSLTASSLETVMTVSWSGTVCTDWQFPVVAVESNMPIINPVSGLQYGQLSVTLAMGSLEQISVYQRTKAGNASAVAVAERPASYLERCLVLQSFVCITIKIKVNFFRFVMQYSLCCSL